MKLEGKIWKDKNFWLVEVPSIDLMAQGRTKKEALFMLKDALEILINNKKFKCDVISKSGEVLYVESESINLLAPFVLRRLRERNKLTIRDVADRLGHKSHTAYVRYESGKVHASLDKFVEYLKAIDKKNDFILKVG